MELGSDTLAVLPEICVLGGAIVVLLLGSFLPRGRQALSRLLAVLALLASATASAVGMTGPAMTVFEANYTVDAASGVARIVISLATVFVIVLGFSELAETPRESETYALLLLASLGAMVLAGAGDLLILITGYLLASIPLYALIGMSRSPRAAEAALKTYLLGALLGITLLVGVTVLYGVGGTTAYVQLGRALASAPAAAVAAGLVGVLAGLMFKAGGVPGHFWVPDATQAASTLVAAFLTTVPKVGALVAAYRLVDLIPATTDAALLVGILATAGMTLGNLAAFWQDDVRRLLGWSTVSQVGYLLLPVAVAGGSDLALPSLLLYLAGYAATNLTAFAVVAALPHHRTLVDYRGVARIHPWLAGALVVSLLGLVGTPPTAVFVGKLTTLTAAWDGGFAWLAVIAVINSVASLFYYLRWLAPMFARTPAVPRPQPMSNAAEAAAPSIDRRPWAAWSAMAGAVAVLILGVLAGGLLSIVGAPLAH
ncbi:NADH-quinone oxidoreductase subunit N [Cryobacterium tepidiphilum]|uniref:NADH-quinone oxidoreductase subunit N n=1 Tax=Cryobacterium tepidiphilum TaxID=2486026 RepID=A0A3M8L1F4_9MICO|nr:NADH-quinone oxidoreductase subunit N [Cryobacterium tepidiphilum]RNE59343.1 NADH-quinone oxidoreductase subunit N [Cryobacterium tepidiphilum]